MFKIEAFDAAGDDPKPRRGAVPKSPTARPVTDGQAQLVKEWYFVYFFTITAVQVFVHR